MSVASVFDFRFPAENAEEGTALARAIGADMPATPGYVRHEVVRDVLDAGHVAVITHWQERSQGESVLQDYVNDAKVARAAELIRAAPAGFLGVLD